MEENLVATFEEAADKLKFEIQKALVPLGYYAFKLDATLGSGRLLIEVRTFDLEDQQELQYLANKGLLEPLDKGTSRPQRKGACFRMMGGDCERGRDGPNVTAP